MPNVTEALDVNDATISVDKYHRFYEHMSKRHSSQVGRDLAWALFGHRDGGPLTVSSRFKMPYHPGYGLVNVWLLRYPAPPPAREGIFGPLLGECFELRGCRSIAGLYLPKIFYV